MTETKIATPAQTCAKVDRARTKLLQAVKNKKAELKVYAENQFSFEDYKGSVQEKIRQINERIDAIGDKRSAETVRLKKQRSGYEQRLRVKSEEQDRKFAIARREKQIKLVLTFIK